MTNLAFFIVMTLAAAGLVTTLTAGIYRWNAAGGKFVAILSRIMLLALISFVTLVTVIVVSGQAGHPL